ncbi:MAG: hypothetical protein PVH88_12545 [Ignavibacteria bacterium]|jgi:hypothetical protein
MIKRIVFIVIVSLIFHFNGCDVSENVDLVDNHVEHIVVQAELVKDSVFEGVQFTKTMSLTEQFDISKAEIKDAVAYIEIDGSQVIPLHYSESGIYKSLHKFRITGNSTYELIAEVNGTLIYSKTIVPDTVIVSSSALIENSYVTCRIKGQTDEVYGAAWSAFPIFKAERFHSIVDGDPDNNYIATVRTQNIPDSIFQFISNELRIEVYSFDKAFKEFFNSVDKSSSLSDIFAQGSGGIVEWNVYGENVIGLFIGYAKSKLLKPNFGKTK